MRNAMWMVVMVLLVGCGEQASTGSTAGEGGEMNGEEGGTPDTEFPQVDGAMDAGTLPPEADGQESDAQEADAQEADADESQGEDILEEGDGTLVETDAAGTETDDTVVESDAAEENDAGTEADAGGEPVKDCPTYSWLEVPEQSGVAYVAHYYTDELRWYRTDGANPYLEGVAATSGLSHGTALDPMHDLLALAHDIDRTVDIYALDRPESPEDTVTPPALVATLELGESSPRVLAFDMARSRLYVAVTDPVTGGGLLDVMAVHVFDTSDPSSPVSLGEPSQIPVTTTLAIDPYAGMLAVVDIGTDKVHLYDSTGPALVPFAGGAIDLHALYPETNSTGFQVRNLRFDPMNGRLLAARGQSALSEVIAFSYPTVVGSKALCPEAPTLQEFSMIADGFDVSQEPADWDNLLGAYDVIPISGSDALMFICNAWMGAAASTIVIPLDGDLNPQTGCGDYAGNGCFYRGYASGNPMSYVQTDGASCVDSTHSVVVGTGVGTPEDDPGSLIFFQYDENLDMNPWLTADGKNPTASGLPIGAECH